MNDNNNNLNLKGYIKINSIEGLKNHYRHVVTLRSKLNQSEYQSIVLYRLPNAPIDDKGEVDNNKSLKYFAMESNCPHAGAPMENASLEFEEGDIEDIDNVIAVLSCPWHSYDFNLETGESSMGIKACTFDIQLCEGDVYINVNNSVDWDIVDTRGVSEEFAESKINPEPVRNANINSENVIDTSNEPKTLSHWATLILKTPDPELKVAYTKRAETLFKTGKIKNIGKSSPPDVPPRHDSLTQVDPSKATKRGKGGSVESRIKILHALANIELFAIDLGWDLIARFSHSNIINDVNNSNRMPIQFFTDVLKLSADEAKHFTLLRRRIEDMGSYFGAYPVHSGLWESALDTKHSLISRLAIVHLVHEARGLDVNPLTIAKFKAAGDKPSSEVLEIIHYDEVSHVLIGHVWFTYLCANSNPPLDPVETFRNEVKHNFTGKLKGPFNVQDRLKAGLNEHFYESLQGEKSSKYSFKDSKLTAKEEALKQVEDDQRQQSLEFDKKLSLNNN